ncbi:Retrovirus-related Pol polyprotein from transposon [Rhizoctonia solani]|uniref:Retrovirus-related Pol polyprotein from transposon n=1 Tax=Rhizoctonia solani TaxID=456999 RepID=A0A8H8SSY6_9AGAM|nr:Retrovirus-related Pol polyprotein from transposon [Rhizoctonia solani]QRW15523.1 Retrovirus-related Pol polyprotein from transposon [Rhizoctonia solani]
MTIPASKQRDDVTGGDTWDKQDFEETTVQVERVIAYWSRILKEAERTTPNRAQSISPQGSTCGNFRYTWKELNLLLSQITPLSPGKTYNNVNRRLMTWGLVFSAYPGMQIVHRAGRVHDNADPISRLREPHINQPSSRSIDSTQAQYGKTH